MALPSLGNQSGAGRGERMTRLSRNCRVSALARGLSAACLAIVPGTAVADWTVDGAHVAVVESTYMPNELNFTIDRPLSTSCPAGTWIVWNIGGTDQASRIANVQTVLSVLLAAKTSGKTIFLDAVNDDCHASYIWLDG
jgi:hypothetical protein